MSIIFGSCHVKWSPSSDNLNIFADCCIKKVVFLGGDACNYYGILMIFPLAVTLSSRNV